MKVKISQEKIAFALNTVSKAINQNSTLQILNNILIEAKKDKGELCFSATNLEIAITMNIQADVIEDGAITVPAKLLTSYILLLSNEDLIIETTEDFSVKIESKKDETKIKGIVSTDYPTIPTIKEEDIFEVPAKIFERSINQTVFAVSINQARPALSGVFMRIEGDILTLAATDSYRLAEKKVKLSKPVKEKIECIIPARTLGELSKIISTFEKAVIEIKISKNQILFKIENINLVSRLIEGGFPDYTKIIPTEHKTSVKVNTSSVLQALKRTSLFTREMNNSVNIEVKKDEQQMVLTTEETRLGEEKIKLDIEITGENNKISVNSQYMLDVLAINEGEKFYMEMSEKLSPVKVRPEKTDDYIYIIMPLKV